MAFELDLERIEMQERLLHWPQFGAETAWKLGSLLHDWAVARSLQITIDVRRFGQLLFYAAIDGSTPDNAEWMRRKSNVVARFHRSSYALGLTLQNQKTTLADKFGLPLADFAAHGGSFPITVSVAGVIGSVTVSGLPQRADHELVVEALCSELGVAYKNIALDG
ncbi:MAG TPA: heme-degrading domain-containing protein [Bryobacteraceae bacterium]|jgi:uncharacterized protein (UPF0303 family)|nr:heme-degrading domain-containing protein [Bryobacteraceae bacterium]